MKTEMLERSDDRPEMETTPPDLLPAVDRMATWVLITLLAGFAVWQTRALSVSRANERAADVRAMQLTLENSAIKLKYGGGR